MKRVFLKGIVAAVALSALGFAQAQTRTIKFANQNAKGHPILLGMDKFAELVDQKSGGKMKVQVFPGGALGSDQANMSALQGGKLVPAELLSQMRTPQPKSGPLNYGLGLFAQDTASETIYHHNGSAPGGYGALMYSNADGTKTLTAAITMGDADVDLLQIFPPALDRLVETVFN